MIGIFLLAFTLSLFSFGTTPAAAGNVAGVRTHLFLTVLRDYDHDAAFSVTYTDALGTHTKPYHAGMEVTAWSPVTITCTNHHVDDWSIDADVQEATIVGVGGITYPGGTGIHVKGTNTIKAFATNFGLHYINIVVILGEGNDNGGDNGDENSFALSVDYGVYVCKRGSCGKRGRFQSLAGFFGDEASGIGIPVSRSKAPPPEKNHY